MLPLYLGDIVKFNDEKQEHGIVIRIMDDDCDVTWDYDVSTFHCSTEDRYSPCDIILVSTMFRDAI